MASYFDHVFHDDELFQKIEYVPRSKEFIIIIYECYIGWLYEKQSCTTDEVFTVAINFIQLKNLYQEFNLDLNTGDDVIIEWLNNEFLSLYFYTGKKYYF